MGQYYGALTNRQTNKSPSVAEAQWTRPEPATQRPILFPEEDRSVSWRPALAYGDKSYAEPSFKTLKIYFPNKEKANSCQINGLLKKEAAMCLALYV